MRVGIFGATGYVGRSLVDALRRRGMDVIPIVRVPSPIWPDALVSGDLTRDAALPETVKLDAVVHLAASTASSDMTGEEVEKAYFDVNVRGTRSALRLAFGAGARHFIYVSSIKAVGERSDRFPLDETAACRPEDAYGRSKLAAEELVTTSSAEAGMNWTIVRPPMIYGPGAGGNFAKLVGVAGSGIPLPFKGLNNRRSLLFVDNLTDFISRILTDESSHGMIFHVADAQPLSTPELVGLIGSASGRRVRMFRFPMALLSVVAAISRRQPQLRRLVDDLAVDIGLAERRMCWRPPISTSDAIKKTIENWK